MNKRLYDLAAGLSASSGGHKLTTGENLFELRSSNDLLDNNASLQNRLDEDGYLLFRDFHDLNKVNSVIDEMSLFLEKNNHLVEGSHRRELLTRSRGSILCTHQHVLEEIPSAKSILEDQKVMELFSKIYGTQSATYDFKWLRGSCAFTPFHFDSVYMGRGSDKLLTCWTPYVDIPLEKGPLLLAINHEPNTRMDKLVETYGMSDVDVEMHNGLFSSDPFELINDFGCTLYTSEFKAGDILIFGMHTMHASLDNTTNEYRISSDSRYQPKNEVFDERWIGEDPIRHYNLFNGTEVSMEESRNLWDV